MELKFEIHTQTRVKDQNIKRKEKRKKKND